MGEALFPNNFPLKKWGLLILEVYKVMGLE
jgi:hypothetical protein